MVVNWCICNGRIGVGEGSVFVLFEKGDHLFTR